MSEDYIYVHVQTQRQMEVQVFCGVHIIDRWVITEVQKSSAFFFFFFFRVKQYVR